jgi:hypothetical protein
MGPASWLECATRATPSATAANRSNHAGPVVSFLLLFKNDGAGHVASAVRASMVYRVFVVIAEHKSALKAHPQSVRFKIVAAKAGTVVLRNAATIICIQCEADV